MSQPVTSTFGLLLTQELYAVLFFFFQAEDGIRDYKVTGVQTCALPISSSCSRAGAAPAPVRKATRPGCATLSSSTHRCRPALSRCSPRAASPARIGGYAPTRRIYG